MKPICVPCQRFYRPKKNGTCFIEQAPTVNSARPGIADAHLWKPYKLWQGDLWECPTCKAAIIVGTGRTPISEHYMDDFEKHVASWAPILKINDC